jgi:hypothetical protein
MPAQVTSIASGDFVTVKTANVKNQRQITIDNLLAAIPVPVGMTKPVTKTAGANTAAAGTTTGDAGVLPAGTAPAYHVTGADGTKGVRVHATDKVTGREIMITNGAAAVLKIYPPAGGAINNAAADAAYSTASGKGALLRCIDSGTNAWSAL